MIKTKSILLNNQNRIHTTTMGFDRIKKNLQLNTEDIVGWCINQINDEKSIATRKGKNWYINIDNCEITINAHSYTIITAHIINNRKT